MWLPAVQLIRARWTVLLLNKMKRSMHEERWKTFTLMAIIFSRN